MGELLARIEAIRKRRAARAALSFEPEEEEPVENVEDFLDRFLGNHRFDAADERVPYDDDDTAPLATLSLDDLLYDDEEETLIEIEDAAP